MIAQLDLVSTVTQQRLTGHTESLSNHGPSKSHIRCSLDGERCLKTDERSSRYTHDDDQNDT